MAFLDLPGKIMSSVEAFGEQKLQSAQSLTRLYFEKNDGCASDKEILDTFLFFYNGLVHLKALPLDAIRPKKKSKWILFVVFLILTLIIVALSVLFFRGLRV